MGLPLAIILALMTATLQAVPSPDFTRSRVLFLMQTATPKEAFQAYKDYKTRNGRHDLELVQQLALTLLDQGFRSNDPDIQLMTLFGAGISTNEKALYILGEGIRSSKPELQLVSLNLLARYQNDRADEAIHVALISPYLLIRLEGAFHLAQKKAPKAVAQTEALMNKVDVELWPIFPQLYALIGNAEATRILRKLLAHSSEAVRISTILSAAESGRDDLLPTIRNLATHHACAQQEACAVALGLMKDESSVPKLQAMLRSGSSTVRLAALHALYSLGRLEETRPAILQMAQAGDLFAIDVLGEIAGSEEILTTLTASPNVHVRINAALALMRRKDTRCLKPLCEILIQDTRDLAITKTYSPGDALSALKAIPSAEHNLKEDQVLQELSLAIREEVLEGAMELPEIAFLQLAHTLFEVQQNDLIPTVVVCLETMNTPNAIALLKQHQQKAGAPLIRNYCNLALYRLKEKGAYADNLRVWVAQAQQNDFIRFRPFIPWEQRDTHETAYQLTPQETSRLLIESFEALIINQDERAIDILLDAIQEGNAVNKYAIAGLLLRASQ